MHLGQATQSVEQSELRPEPFSQCPGTPRFSTPSPAPSLPARHVPDQPTSDWPLLHSLQGAWSLQSQRPDCSVTQESIFLRHSRAWCGTRELRESTAEMEEKQVSAQDPHSLPHPHFEAISLLQVRGFEVSHKGLGTKGILFQACLCGAVWSLETGSLF